MNLLPKNSSCSPSLNSKRELFLGFIISQRNPTVITERHPHIPSHMRVLYQIFPLRLHSLRALLLRCCTALYYHSSAFSQRTERSSLSSLLLVSELSNPLSIRAELFIWQTIIPGCSSKDQCTNHLRALKAEHLVLSLNWTIVLVFHLHLWNSLPASPSYLFTGCWNSSSIIDLSCPPPRSDRMCLPLKSTRSLSSSLFVISLILLCCCQDEVFNYLHKSSCTSLLALYLALQRRRNDNTRIVEKVNPTLECDHRSKKEWKELKLTQWARKRTEPTDW